MQYLIGQEDVKQQAAAQGSTVGTAAMRTGGGEDDVACGNRGAMSSRTCRLDWQMAGLCVGEEDQRAWRHTAEEREGVCRNGHAWG